MRLVRVAIGRKRLFQKSKWQSRVISYFHGSHRYVATNPAFWPSSGNLLSKAEMASRHYCELLENATRRRISEPAYEVSVADAAKALGVSEQTVRNWDQNGCPFDPKYVRGTSLWETKENSP